MASVTRMLSAFLLSSMHEKWPFGSLRTHLVLWNKGKWASRKEKMLPLTPTKYWNGGWLPFASFAFQTRGASLRSAWNTVWVWTEAQPWLESFIAHASKSWTTVAITNALFFRLPGCDYTKYLRFTFAVNWNTISKLQINNLLCHLSLYPSSYIGRKMI